MERKRRRREYLKDFQQNEDGSYGYNGTCRECTLDKDAFRREMTIQFLQVFLPFALSFGAGCMRGTGMEGCFYLLLPYAGGLIAMILTNWAILQLLRAGPRLRSYVYEKTVRVLPRRMMCGVILSAAALAGVAYGVIRRSYGGEGLAAVLFILSQAAVLTGSLANYRRVRRIKWK